MTKTDKKEESKSLTTISKVTTEKFIEKVNEQIVEKYAKDMVQIMEDKKRLDKAVGFVDKIIAEVEEGNFTAIERYKKKRNKLETEEDADFE